MPLSAKRLNSPDGVERGRDRKGHYPRESKDTPNEKAFCLVAPTVLLSDLAILLAGIFCFHPAVSARPRRARRCRMIHGHGDLTQTVSVLTKRNRTSLPVCAWLARER